MGVMPHPEVYIFIPIYVPDFGALCSSDKKRVRRKVVKVVRYSSRHDFSGPPEKSLRFFGFLPIDFNEVFHAIRPPKLNSLPEYIKFQAPNSK
jgi:hypothetical protein